MALTEAALAFAVGNFLKAGLMTAVFAASNIAAGAVASLAEGGIVQKHGLYELGEGNRPEAVIPLSKGGLGTTINIYGSVMTEDQAARKILAVGSRIGRGY